MLLSLALEKQIVSLEQGPRASVTFPNKRIFYGEELLAPRQTPNFQGHPFSAARDCLFNIFAATLFPEAISSIRILRTRHTVVTKDPSNNILFEFGIPMKLVRLIKMCLNETYSAIRVGKHFSDHFSIQTGTK
jgi:hypothetical protein